MSLRESGEMECLTAEARHAIEQELEAICSEPRFRSSQRNCEFLRYVVRTTLSGRAAEIKERTLGAELFGRPATYDTGSDAVVRVRANDVRKRLARHYEEHRPCAGWRIELPTRTYVPLFLEHAPETPATPAAAVAAPVPAPIFEEAPQPSPRMLEIRHMMVPTLVALFLCAATFRWQVFSGSPYLDFWQTLLHGRTSLSVVLDPDPQDPESVSLKDLDAIEPLLSTASSFNVHTQVRSASARTSASSPATIRITHQPELCQPRTSLGARHAGVHITVTPQSLPALCIAGADDRDLRSAVASLTSHDAFPQPLEMAMDRGQPTRLRIAEDQPIAAEAVTGP